MDLKNKVVKLEDILVVNPFDKKNSWKECQHNLQMYDFFTQVYPDSIMKQLLDAVRCDGSIKPPKCIFIPDRKIMQTMIKANI
jgi:hypothetical protein